MKYRRHITISSQGFTLIEAIVVIGILAIVAGAMAPLALQMIDGSRRDHTIERQKTIVKAILGDTSAPGSGFLSDIGRLPNTNLTELTTGGSLPPHAYQPCGVKMGWRGPYLLEGTDAIGLPLDGWGTPMALIGGQIHSAGPDRNPSTTDDNIVHPQNPLNASTLSGTVALTVLALDNSTSQPTFVPAAGQATLYYAQNGLMQSVLLTSVSGSYVYPSSGSALPQGIYAITIIGDPDGAGPQPSLTRTITTYCPGGGTVHQTVALRGTTGGGGSGSGGGGGGGSGSGSPPGLGGTPPGLGGTPPGRSGTTPGRSGTLPSRGRSR